MLEQNTNNKKLYDVVVPVCLTAKRSLKEKEQPT
jgi:hypothetical protein